jgi:shikimate dehydrogenase
MNIDQNTDLYAVVGYPIGHSLSPTMHNAAFSAAGLNAIYLAFEAEDTEDECDPSPQVCGDLLA